MARRRYYIMKDGARLYRDTLQEIKAVALREANRAGKAVRVMFEELDSLGRSVRSKPAVRQPVARFHASRNPMLQGHDFTGEQWKITGKSPRGTTVHAYASSKGEADLEARVLRSAGYRAVQTMRTKAPVEGITRRKVMGRNPVSKHVEMWYRDGKQYALQKVPGGGYRLEDDRQATVKNFFGTLTSARTQLKNSDFTRRNTMKRNPAPKKRKRTVGACYVEWRNAGRVQREKFANKGLATVAANEMRKAGYAAVRVVASGKKP